MANHRLVRTVLGLLWFASAVIVLATSSIGAYNDRKAGTYRPVIALNIATASLTIIYELIWLPGRFILGGQLTSLVTEAAITTILWALWIAAATAYTVKTAATRDLCGNLALLPKKVVTANDLVKTCRVYKVNLAFSWVAVGVATIILLYTIYVANSGDGAHLTTSFGDVSGRSAPASTAHADAKADEVRLEVTQTSPA